MSLRMKIDSKEDFADIIEYFNDPHIDESFMHELKILMLNNRKKGDWRKKSPEGRYSLSELRNHIFQHALDLYNNKENGERHVINIVANCMMYVYFEHKLQDERRSERAASR